MPTIEQNLERIADALEKIAASAATLSDFAKDPAPKAATSAPVKSGPSAEEIAAAEAADATAKKAAEKKAADAKKVAEKKAADEAAAAAAALDEPKPSTATSTKSTWTKDDVRKALQAYREIEGTPAMLDVLKKAGAANLNELAEGKYDEVMAAVS